MPEKNTPALYSPDLFVNREDKIQFILTNLNALRQRKSPGWRTIIFKGQRGIGKSWLLRHIYQTVKEQTEVLTFFLDLDQYHNSTSEEIVIKIIKAISQDIFSEGGQLFESLTSLANISARFFEQLRPKLQEKPFLLIVDTVFESDWELLMTLENHLLGPLIVEPQVMLLMAGRGRAFPWKTPELRIRAKFKELSQLSKEDTIKQLEKLDANQIQIKKRREWSHIFRTSEGNPLLNVALATQKDEVTALNNTLEAILTIVPADKRQQLRDHFLALCVLRAFDEERIPLMLAKYYEDERYKEMSYPEIRAIREEIVKLGFANWDEDKGGYVIDPIMRNIFEEYLHKANPAKWKGLHQTAYGLYNDWAIQFERTRSLWNKEKEYHSAEGELEQNVFPMGGGSVLLASY